MIVTNKRQLGFLRLETVYFPEDPKTYQTDADIVLFYFSETASSVGRKFKTLQIDLSQESEAILADTHTTTRKTIRRYMKSPGFFVDTHLKAEAPVIEAFISEYRAFTEGTRIPPVDEAFLLRMGAQGKLSVILAKDHAGRTLGGMVTLLDEPMILGLYSFVHFRRCGDRETCRMFSDVGRVLVWEAVLFYKVHGFHTFDLGGLGMGEEGPSLDSVDRFKMSFGGQIRSYYHYYMGMTLMGKMILMFTRRNRRIEY